MALEIPHVTELMRFTPSASGKLTVKQKVLMGILGEMVIPLKSIMYGCLHPSIP